MIRNNTTLALVASFVLGFAIGLFLFGWGLTPVRFTNGGPQHLSEGDLKNYVAALADVYSADNNILRVRGALCNWDKQENEPGAVAAALSALAAKETDPAYQQRLQQVAGLVRGEDCAVFNQVAVAGESGASPWLTILLWLLLLGLLAGGAYYFFFRRQPDRSEARATVTPPPAAPVVVDEGGSAAAEAMTTLEESEEAPISFQPIVRPPARATEPDLDITPLAGFETTYVRGDDSYDKSFIIENAQGDFLGECGVSISESLGAENSKNVTAFEVWLFDKGDTHTITKVVMSEHAYRDEAARARLATRGEPTPAEPGEVIVLETAALIVNAEILEVAYNSLQGAQNSVFDRLSMQLSAWVKGDSAENSAGR